MKKIVCPICGSEMDVNEETGFATCIACNTKVQVADHYEVKTQRIIEDAKIKQAELEFRKMELEEKHRLEEKQEQITIKKEKGKNAMTIFILCLVFVGFIIFAVSAFFKPSASEDSTLSSAISSLGVVFIMAGIIIAIVRASRNKKNKESEEERQDKD